MDKSWLVRMFEEAGLPSDQAERAAEATQVRLLRRERARGLPSRARRSLTEFLVRDPLVSLNRIVGRGDAGLPFFDDETKTLSLIAFGNALSAAGIDAVVAMAYAKVMVEMFEPKDLYAPIWQALGKTGTLDLDELRRMDWSPLRSGLPATAGVADTVVAPAAPQLRPPPARASETSPSTLSSTPPAGPRRPGAPRARPLTQPASSKPKP